MKKLSYINILIYISLFIFLPLTILNINNIGTATAYNGDIIGYFESLKKIYYGFSIGDFKYALDFNTYGYGSGMFIFLSIILVPIQYIFPDNEVIMIFFLRTFGIFSFIVCLYFINKIYLYFNNGKINKYYLWSSIIIIVYPSTWLLITRIHPEIFQLSIVLLGIYLLLKYDNDSRNIKNITILSIVWAFNVGIKISGIIFLIIPYIVLFKYIIEKRKQAILHLIIFTFFCCISILIFVEPYVLIDFYDGIIKFKNELSYFSSTLQTMSYSDFDNYQVLNSRLEVIRGWLTYAFQHGYLGCIWMIIIIFLSIRKIFILIKNNNFNILFYLTSGILITFLVNCLYYILFITRISVYYYYIPICLLTIIVFIDFKILVSNKYYIYFFVFITCVLSLSSITHDKKIYKEQVELSHRLSRTEYRSENLKNWILDRNIPYHNILLPTSLNIGFQSDEINWIPQYSSIDLSKRNLINIEGGYTEKIDYYWKLDDILDRGSEAIVLYDLIVIDKLQNENLKSINNILIENSFTVAYEDNFTIAYSRHTSNSTDSANLVINRILEENSSKLKLVNNEWCGLNINLPELYNFNSYSKIKISFFIDNLEEFQELRLVFNGYCTFTNENTWHYVLKQDDVSVGYNEFILDKYSFILQQGYIDWGNISNIGFGGVGNGNQITKIYIELME